MPTQILDWRHPHGDYGQSHWPLFLIVEAESVSDAIDALVENEKYGHNIVVANADLGDYPEDDRHYAASSQVIDTDHLMVHGLEGADCPFTCRYFGEGLPEKGIKPTDFSCHGDE